MEQVATQPSIRIEPRGQEEKRSKQAQRNMRIQPRLQAEGRADFDQHDSEKRSCSERGPAKTSQQKVATEQWNSIKKEEKR